MAEYALAMPLTAVLLIVLAALEPMPANAVTDSPATPDRSDNARIPVVIPDVCNAFPAELANAATCFNPLLRPPV